MCVFVLTVLAHIIVHAAPMPRDEPIVHPLEPADAAEHTQQLQLHKDSDDRNRRASNPSPIGYAPVDGFFEGPNRGIYTQRGIFQHRSRSDKNDDDQIEDGPPRHRNRRASDPYPMPVGYAPVDGFFEGPNRGAYSQPAPFERPTRYDANYDDYDDSPRKTKKPAKKPNRRQEFVGPQGPPKPADGNKYVYTPLFKYKATHHKHHKLFVPNIFG